NTLFCELEKSSIVDCSLVIWALCLTTNNSTNNKTNNEQMRKIIKDSGCCKENTIVGNQNTVNNTSHLIIPFHLQPVIFITSPSVQLDKRTLGLGDPRSSQMFAGLPFDRN
ncbi:MAG: hypothetical protein ACI87J_002223, partial [Colwellia sp.]